MRRIFQVLTIAILLPAAAYAVESTPSDSVLSYNPSDEMVIVGNDTISMILPEKNYGRFDRGLKNYLFIPKGEWMFGLTASYGEFNSDDVQILSLLKDFDFGGKMYSVKPSVAYFFKNNNAIGVRFSYTRGDAGLDNLVVDFDEDLNFEIKDVSYRSRGYSASVFHRTYIGLGTMKRLGIFNDTDLSFGGSSNRFRRYYAGEPRETHTSTFEARLSFNPGLTVFIMDNVSFNVSFGVIGFYFKNEKQKTNDVEEGSRFSSGADFKFNVFNINFGLGVHI